MLQLAIIFFVGYFFIKYLLNKTSYEDSQQNREYLFKLSMVRVLAAAMMADGRVVRSELDVVKRVLLNQFGEDEAKRLLQTLKDELSRPIDIRDAAIGVSSVVDYASKVRIAHILCEIAEADGIVTDAEYQTVLNISYYMGLTRQDTLQIMQRLYVNGSDGGSKSSQQKQTSSNGLQKAYETLGITQEATNAELKDAYRKKVKQYHPDRFAGASAEEQAKAGDKFKEIQSAYEYIKKARGL